MIHQDLGLFHLHLVPAWLRHTEGFTELLEMGSMHRGNRRITPASTCRNDGLRPFRQRISCAGGCPGSGHSGGSHVGVRTEATCRRRSTGCVGGSCGCSLSVCSRVQKPIQGSNAGRCTRTSALPGIVLTFAVVFCCWLGGA